MLFRKRFVKERTVEDAGKHKKFKPKNDLKLALLQAMEASSNDDFDVIDVMYAVAKTFKGQRSFSSRKFVDTSKMTGYVKKKMDQRQGRKKSVQFDPSTQHDINDVANEFPYNIIFQNVEYKNHSYVPLQTAKKLYNNIFSTPKAEPRVKNLFNVPVDDQFLGFLAIPTNQALAVSC